MIKPPTNETRNDSSLEKYDEKSALEDICAFPLCSRKDKKNTPQELIAVIEFVSSVKLYICSSDHLLYIIGVIEDCLFRIAKK